MTKNILIVSPVYNESAELDKFVEAIESLRSQLLPNVVIRLMLVNDGSTDDSLFIIRKHAASHSDWLYYLSFTANFGYQAALIAGLVHSGAWPDALITMDSDLEHPVEVVPKLIDVWKNSNCIVVNTMREDSPELALTKRIMSKLFYRLTCKLTGLDLKPGQADFKLWDAKILRSLQLHLPNVGSLRVFSAWLPGKKAVVTYRQNVVSGRVSRFTFKKNWDLAMISIVRFSSLPLRAIGLMGAAGALLSLFYVVFVAFQAATGHEFRGWASTVLTIVFMGCLQLISVGILASYLRRLVFAKDLPLYIIDESKQITTNPMVPASTLPHNEMN